VSATARAPARPAAPVKALAFPLLTTSARAPPCLSWVQHHSTGAELVLDLVNTPATWVPGASNAKSTSVRFWYLTPAVPVASRTPARGGSRGWVLGARGEVLWPAALGATAADTGWTDFFIFDPPGTLAGDSVRNHDFGKVQGREI